MNVSTKTLYALNLGLIQNNFSFNVAKAQSLVIGSRKCLKDLKQGGVIKSSFAVDKETVSII